MDCVDQIVGDVAEGGAGSEEGDAAELLGEVQHPYEHVERALACRDVVEE